MNLIKRAWKGEERLWIVFWLYNIVFGVIANLLSGALMTKAGSLWPVVTVLYLTYVVWLLVAMWRCAFNARFKIWGYLVRIFFVVLPVLAVPVLLIMGTFAEPEEVKDTGCDQLIKEYQAAVHAGADAKIFYEQHKSELQACAKGESKREGVTHE